MNDCMNPNNGTKTCTYQCCKIYWSLKNFDEQKATCQFYKLTGEKPVYKYDKHSLKHLTSNQVEQIKNKLSEEYL